MEEFSEEELNRQSKIENRKSKIKRGLSTGLIGSEIHLFEDVISTNEVAKGFASEGKKEGTVIISESQSKGKGRAGRSWLSPKGVGIYLSVILKPNIPSADVSQLTLVAGVAAAQAIEDVSRLLVSIKWPNDLMIGKKKLGGILLETGSTGSTLNYVIIGIGINVNTDISSFTQEVRSTATSIKDEKGVSLKRIRLIRRLLERLDDWYEIYISGGIGDVIEAWSDLSNTLNHHIVVTSSDRITKGVAVGISHNGALLVKQADGCVEEVMEGDVTRT